MRIADRLSIYALSFAVVGLVALLLWQKSRKTGDTGEIAPSDFVSRMNKQNAEMERDLAMIRSSKKLGGNNANN